MEVTEACVYRKPSKIYHIWPFFGVGKYRVPLELPQRDIVSVIRWDDDAGVLLVKNVKDKCIRLLIFNPAYARLQADLLPPQVVTWSVERVHVSISYSY